jgi:hypothetical protein
LNSPPVSGVPSGGGDAIGIRTSNYVSGSIRGNRMRGLVKEGSGQAFGIFNFFPDHLAIRNNDLDGDGNASQAANAANACNGRTGTVSMLHVRRQ